MDTSSQILRPQKKIHIIIGETMQLSEINGKQMSQGMDSRFQEAIRHLKSMTAEKSRLVNRQKAKKPSGIPVQVKEGGTGIQQSLREEL